MSSSQILDENFFRGEGTISYFCSNTRSLVAFVLSAQFDHIEATEQMSCFQTMKQTTTLDPLPQTISQETMMSELVPDRDKSTLTVATDGHRT